MKTDKFDESIRRKLESIDPPITDREVDTIHRLVRGAKSAATNMAAAIKYALVALVGIVATAIVIWNTNTHTEEKIALEHTIDSLQQQLATLPNSTNVDTTSYTQTIPNQLAETKPAKLEQPIPTVNQSTILPEKTQAPQMAFQDKPEVQNPTTVEIGFPKIEYVYVASKGIYLIKPSTPDFGNLNVGSLPPPESNHAKTRKPKIEQPNDTLYPRFNIGLGTDFTKGANSGSIVAEYTFNKNWNVSAGMKIMWPQPDFYNDDRDFEREKHGQRFHQKYVSNEPDTSRYLKIKVEHIVLQLPIYVAYNLPFKKSYSAQFSVGTEIDLLDRQIVHFEAQQKPKPGPSRPLPPPVKRELETNGTVAIFNNTNLYIGLQKSWNRYTLQLGGYGGMQLAEADYRKDKVYGGVRLRALVRIGG